MLVRVDDLWMLVLLLLVFIVVREIVEGDGMFLYINLRKC